MRSTDWIFGELLGLKPFRATGIGPEGKEYEDQAMTQLGRVGDFLVQRTMLAQNINAIAGRVTDRILNSTLETKGEKLKRNVDMLRMKKEFGLTDDDLEKMMNDKGADDFSDEALYGSKLGTYYGGEAKSFVNKILGGLDDAGIRRRLIRGGR
jgi:hypothetical protein